MFLLAVMISGCDVLNVWGLHTERFVVRVDSIAIPAITTPTDTLIVHFRGGLGSDGCSRLDRVERRRVAGRLELTFHGARKNGNCIQMPAMMDHVEKIVPPLENPFTIRVTQPSGKPVEKVVSFQKP